MIVSYIYDEVGHRDDR